MTNNSTGRPNLNIADTININYHIGSDASSRTTEDVIQRYMPKEVEEHIWRQAVIQNIRTHLKKIYLNADGFTVQPSRKEEAKELHLLDNLTLWKTHEYVLSIEDTERVRQIKEIEKIRKKRRVNFEDFQQEVFRRLKIHVPRYEQIVDDDLRLLHGFVTTLWK